MRVVGGSARGRRLRAPGGEGVRPTSDRVREAIFDVLMSLDAVEGSTVVDLFAGSGALGIEALSRGARSATFVESGREAVASIRANLATTAMGDRAEVVRAGVLEWLAGEGSTRRFDLALCDPPYGFDRWAELLDLLRADLAVLESSRVVEAPPSWEAVKVKRYGGTVVTLIHQLPRPSRKGLT